MNREEVAAGPGQGAAAGEDGAHSSGALAEFNGARAGEIVSYRDEPETRFRRRFVADLVKLLPIDSQV